MYVRMKYKNFTILHVAIQGARVDEECPIVRGRGEFLGKLFSQYSLNFALVMAIPMSLLDNATITTK